MLVVVKEEYPEWQSVRSTPSGKLKFAMALGSLIDIEFVSHNRGVCPSSFADFVSSGISLQDLFECFEKVARQSTTI